jgi:hypothetical protein
MGAAPMVVNAQNVVVNDDGALCCPRCRSDYLRHRDVEVFNRRQEDGITNAVLVPALGGPKVGYPIANPSNRRNGIVIEFICENCGEEACFALAIAQHKGRTFLGWLGVDA